MPVSSCCLFVNMFLLVVLVQVIQVVLVVLLVVCDLRLNPIEKMIDSGKSARTGAVVVAERRQSDHRPTAATAAATAAAAPADQRASAVMGAGADFTVAETVIGKRVDGQFASAVGVMPNGGYSLFHFFGQMPVLIKSPSGGHTIFRAFKI